MRATRSTRNSTTEKRLISLLAAHHVTGWRVRPRGIPRSPDFVFPKRRLVMRRIPLRGSCSRPLTYRVSRKLRRVNIAENAGAAIAEIERIVETRS